MRTSLSSAGLAAAALLPLAAHAADFATVVSSTPVVASVAVPRRVCNEAQQSIPPQPSGAGAVIGAIAGGLLGNTIGGGFGRAAATGIGAVAGAAIGNGVEVNAANGYPPTNVPVQRCRTVSGYENRTVGYDVVYEYNGQRYSTRMARDPGSSLAIDVRPAGAGSAALDRLGPPSAYAPVPPAYAEPQGYAGRQGTPVPPAYDTPSGAFEPAPPDDREPSPYGYYYGAPAPAPVYYYSPGATIAPVIIGAGFGYWIGSTWHRGYRSGYPGRWR